ncbi:heavy metal translocating P-type ATPase [Gordonia sp. OPL2]|uniref:heavy metal translocating P-type ATPase n=1 Tax=Gordonia sp. OPL2 TaxID=2486274 RepID=UPI001655A279|nr:heavy metal translocating P-type ATPase [Gordonia sp. OPL2]ROZ86493.1 cadmium-translocating P-type ATPase [Gordonia sp. OPL2]
MEKNTVAGSPRSRHGHAATHHEDADAHHDHAGHGGHGAHDGHAGHGDHVALFRRLFWAMTVLAVPVVIASPMFADLVGYSLPSWGIVDWISPVLGTVMLVWGGRPFLAGAVGELRSRAPGMMTLIALAISVAFVASWGASLGVLHHELDFWWELALLIVIMLLGHWIEMRSIAQTTSALQSLAALLPDEAERVVGDEVTTVPPSELRAGDTVIVRPGGRVPADGEIVSGTADVDESMITGESALVTRTVGDKVVAGTVSADTAIRVRVTAVGDDTTLAGIQRLVAEAQNSSSRAQRLADRAAGWLFWFALGAAVLTAVVWTAVGQPDNAVIRTITVLVIACPHALGLAIPLVVAIATERAAKMGVLVTDRIALETLRLADVVLFDKTGTLTRGEPAVVDVVADSETGAMSGGEVLALAAAAESDSEHPLGAAVVRAARERGLNIPVAQDFSSSAAVGVRAVVNGLEVAVGGPRLLEDRRLDAIGAADRLVGNGNTVLHVVVDGRVVGALALADEVRPESAEAVRALGRRGVEAVMATGDARDVAERVAAELGIERVYAGVRPEDKESIVADLQSEGNTVVMVGDGVNDAPALARADVGVAIGAGTDVAIGSAGVVLAGDDPRTVVSAMDLSAQAYRKMTQNLWWAAGYNLISVPLAAGVLAPIGFVLPMAIGAILMSASTVIVALNAQLLRRADLSVH